jgi:hypothetical protein
VQEPSQIMLGADTFATTLKGGKVKALTLDDIVHPLSAVIVTVYDPETGGEIVLVDVVAPLLQRYENPGSQLFTESTIGSLGQFCVCMILQSNAGNELTYKCKEAVQPCASVIETQ